MKSSSWWESTAAYASFGFERDASIIETMLHGFSPGGVTFVHVPHESVVTQISPSSVPAHTRPASMGEGAIV